MTSSKLHERPSYNPNPMRKGKKPAITSEWRENKIAQEKAQREANLVARQFAREKAVTTVTKGARSAVGYFLAIGSCVLALFLALSLFTYSPLDPGFSVTGGATIENLCGITGAWIANFLYWLLGGSAWWLVLVFLSYFVSSVLIALARREQGGWLRNLGAFASFIVLMLSSVTLEALQLSYLGGSLPSGAGGICGREIATLVVPLLGVWGTTLVSLFLLAGAAGVLFHFSWGCVFEWLGTGCEKAFNYLFRRNRAAKIEEVPTSPLANASQADPWVSPKEEPASDVATSSDMKELTNPPSSVVKRKPSGRIAQGELFHEGGRILPSFDLLESAPLERNGVSEETVGITSRLIESKLKSYHIDAHVVGAQIGPVITQYMLDLSDGVKGSQVEKICKDLTRALAVHSIRVVSAVPGKPYMGLEIPNNPKQRLSVYLSEIIGSSEYENAKSLLSLALGRDITGNPVVVDLSRMPHLLVGGATGSGKSVAVNTMILSLLFKCDPSQLRLVLIDPKTVEFSLYEGIPHLLCPVVTDMNKAANALSWLVREMDHRYELMSKMGVRSFDAFNEKVKAAQLAGTPLMEPIDESDANPEPPKPLKPFPYIVCFIDELADLMLVKRKEVEIHIMRLAQKARAAGMHVVVATQRPSVDIVTPLIKANIVARICFQVANRFDSQTVLDTVGAQELLGRGDMLLRLPGNSLMRVQGCMVSDREVEAVANQLKSMAAPEYVEDVTDNVDANETSVGIPGHHSSGESDPLYDQAVRKVLEDKRPTTSYVQRRFNIGYNRAANLLEAMEDAGIISKPNPAGKREILVRTGELFQ